MATFSRNHFNLFFKQFQIIISRLNPLDGIIFKYD